MIKTFPQNIFVTGTDTNVGKTIVSSIICAGTGAAYLKPIQSGTTEETDSQFVRRLTEMQPAKLFRENYLLKQPLSPHAAAVFDGVSIAMEHIQLPEHRFNHMIVEGCGGLLVPLNESYLVIDLIDQLKTPVILVARSTLGTINHTLLSLAALKARNIEVLGVVMNGPRNKSNRQAIEYYGQATVLAEIPHLAKLDFATLRKTFADCFDTAYFKEDKDDGNNFLSDLASVYTDENSPSTADCEISKRSPARTG